MQKYTAYTTRHTSKLKALRSGTNIDTIIKAAGWSQKSQVFNKFYNRTVSENFATGVLKNL